jgi:hypothetical protein
VPFQELDIKALQKRKDAMEDEAERCEGLRNFLYEDFKEGIITKQDYAELRGGYTEKIKKAEQAIRNIELQIQEIIEEKSEKYKWLGYFTEHQNIKELTRTVAVELIEQIKIYDKKTIEVVFTFDDCYRLVLEQMKELGCTVTESTNGRVYIEGKEVAKDGKKIKEN